MATDSSNGGIGLLGVLIGAAIVAVVAFFFVGDRLGLRSPGDVNVKVELPKKDVPAPQ